MISQEEVPKSLKTDKGIFLLVAKLSIHWSFFLSVILTCFLRVVQGLLSASYLNKTQMFSLYIPSKIHKKIYYPFIVWSL